eukprot:SAG31_NODE_2359_length_5873_cov_2.496363_6_plen_158_part_00
MPTAMRRAAALLWLLAKVLAVASAEGRLHEAAPAGSAPTSSEAAVREAEAVRQLKLCGAQPISEALHSVWLEDEPAETATQLLANELGIRTALDMQLVEADGQEAHELFDSLKSGGLTVGARAKIRLLLRPQQQRKRKYLLPQLSPRDQVLLHTCNT